MLESGFYPPNQYLPAPPIQSEKKPKGGIVTLIGNVTPHVGFPLQSVVTREITVYGSCASANDYPACLELMGSGAIKAAPIISAAVPLEQGAEMFDRLYAKEPGLTKVILRP